MHAADVTKRQGDMDAKEDTRDMITPSDVEGEVTAENIPRTQNAPGTHWLLASFMVVNAALGAGLLNFPQAFDHAGGIKAAIIIQAVLLAFIFGSLLLLGYCAEQTQQKTYQGVAGLCGKRWQYLTSILIGLYCYGTCITFLVIIGDQIDRALVSLWGSDFCHHWFLNRSFTITASSLFLIGPFCFPKRIDFLRYISSLGVLAIIYVDFLIIYKYYEGAGSLHPNHPFPRQTKKAWTAVFLVVPVICFGYQCHVSAIPIYSCIKKRSVSTFARSIGLALSLCILTYSLAGTFGYLTFGSGVASDILIMYDAKDPLVIIGITALAIKMYTTYPILLFCGREAILDLYYEVYPLASLSGNNQKHRILVATTWFLTSLLLAVLIPNITDIIDFLGSLAAVFIFILPGLFLLHMTLNGNDHPGTFSWWKIILASVSITLGTFLFGLVFVQAVEEDLSHRSEGIQLCI